MTKVYRYTVYSLQGEVVKKFQTLQGAKNYIRKIHQEFGFIYTIKNEIS